MGESGLQLAVCQLLMELLRSFFTSVEHNVLIGGNQFFYYREGAPEANVAPDVYVIEDEDTPLVEVKSWKVWEHEGKAPALAVEVVSSEYRKDYDGEFLERYEALGVRELIRYDPQSLPRPRRRGGSRALLSHFVRNDSGRLMAQPSAADDRVRSALYDFWLVHVPPSLLRLGVGPHGTALWPTDRERAAADRERAAAEAERAATEAERASRAEAELARVRAELDQLRRGQ